MVKLEIELFGATLDWIGLQVFVLYAFSFSEYEIKNYNKSYDRNKH